mmetsp:Transcript_29193/g.69317  ORF Transcript_29193/g.69317 Transcript_29193/m.69317 type:complete len:273 (+) Transcript_29193:158-976(+)
MPTSQADMEKLLKDWWISGTKRLHLGSGRLQAYTAGEMQQLCSLIPKAHPDVKGLLMFSNALDDAQAAAVPEALERLPHLKGLSLHGDNKFGGEAAAKIFIAAVRHCLHLDELFMPEHCDPNTVDWAQLGVTMSAQVLAAAKKDGIIWQWAARILTGGGYWDWGPMVKKQREMQAAGLVAPLPTVPDAGWLCGSVGGGEGGAAAAGGRARPLQADFPAAGSGASLARLRRPRGAIDGLEPLQGHLRIHRVPGNPARPAWSGFQTYQMLLPAV